MVGSEVFCKLLDVADLIVFKNTGNDCSEPLSVYAQKISRKRKMRREVWGAVRYVQNKAFEEVDRAALDISSEPSGMPVFCYLADGFYETGGD